MATAKTLLLFGAAVVLTGCSPSPIPAPSVLADHCAIDTPVPDAASASSSVGGWLYPPAGAENVESAAFRFSRADGLVYQRPIRMGGERPDVVQVLHLGDVQVTGFHDEVDIGHFAPGHYQASILLISQGKRFICPTAYGFDRS